MSGNPSAYATLGLEPGADPAAVDVAYRQLIKRYHPDRQGGDPARAAEINRAYCEIRQTPPQPAERASLLDLGEALYAERLARRRYVPQPRRPRRRWPLVAVLLAAIVYAAREPLLTLAADFRADVTDMFAPTAADGDQARAMAGDVPFDAPLHRSDLDMAIRRAAALAAGNDPGALSEGSRTCHRALRQAPTLPRLDRCAAFDHAVLELQNRASVQEEGPFAASMVTARQMAAAKLLTTDYQAIEERLDRVRAHVKLALAPANPAGPAGSSMTQPVPGAAGSLPPLVRGADRPAAH